MPRTLVVTGAAGQLGRLVLDNLLERNSDHIIAATRDPSKLSSYSAKGVEIRAADFDKPDTLRAAFSGADRLLMISTNQIFTPGQRLAQQKSAIAAAGAAGVQHILYTGVPAPAPNPDTVIESDHFWTEAAIIESSMSWTFLRNGLYTELLLQSLPRAIATGVYATATKNKGRHYVTRADCARAAAGALSSSDSTNRIYDITGPTAVTADEVAALAAQITGKNVIHKAISTDEFRAGLIAAKLPAPVIGAATGFEIATAQGYYAIVTSAVQELTGSAGEDVQTFLARNRDKLLT